MTTGTDQADATPAVIKASEFKAKCLQLMDRVANTGEQIVITKNGRPVSRLVPYRTKPRTLFGIDRGMIKIVGDIVGPIEVAGEAQAGYTSRR